MSIKLLISDLDGTLISDLHTIPPRTQAALKAAMRQGVRVTIATGREWPVTQKFVKTLGLTSPVICYQGALIYDPQAQETIASEGFSLPLAQQLIDLTRQHKLALYLYLGHTAFTEAPTALSRAILDDTGIATVEVADLKQVTTDSPIKGLIVHPAEGVEPALAQLRAALNGQLNIFRSLDTLTEVTSPNVSKGHALALLADYYNLDRSEVMAIGDQDNDVDMIEWAGLGIAMGNASARAKAVADHIAPPVGEEGAAWAIERFILGSD